MHESEKWKWSRSVMSDSLRPYGLQPTRLLHPRDSPGKNTGVGCHFLLQCMRVKSEREVAQLCLTLSDPMDCSLPGSSVHGIFQARVLEWGAIAFSDYKVTIIKKLWYWREAQEGGDICILMADSRFVWKKTKQYCKAIILLLLLLLLSGVPLPSPPNKTK